MFCLISVRNSRLPRSHGFSAASRRPPPPHGASAVPPRRSVRATRRPPPGVLRFRAVPRFLQIRQSRLRLFPGQQDIRQIQVHHRIVRIEPRGRLEHFGEFGAARRTGLRDGEHLVQAQASPAGCAGVPALRPHRIPGCGNLFCNPCGAASDNYSFNRMRYDSG